MPLSVYGKEVHNTKQGTQHTLNPLFSLHVKISLAQDRRQAGLGQAAEDRLVVSHFLTYFAHNAFTHTNASDAPVKPLHISMSKIKS